MWRFYIASAIDSLRGSPLRSLLAVLGVVIGVASVVAMLAIGNGTRVRILQDVAGSGAQVILVTPDDRNGAVDPRPLTLADAQALITLPDVLAVTPVTEQNGVTLRAGPTKAQSNLLATADTWPRTNQAPLAAGRWFTPTESDAGVAVCVLGATTAKDLFPGGGALGASILVGPLPTRVIGVMEPQGNRSWYDPDRRFVMPLGAARRGILATGQLWYIQVLCRSIERLEPLRDAVGRELLRRHRRVGIDQRDFGVSLYRDMIKQVEKFTGIFSAMLGGVGAISLLVGGIGIMNIMLVTVTERTREIGLRKAVGARERDIRTQFLIEAVVITGLGGIGGILCGWCISLLAGLAMPFPPVLDAGSIIMAFAFSVGIGLFFGWYPARRAAKLDPIEALRHE